MNDSGGIPLFSIITITKNNLQGLRKTYESVASQSEQKYEWVVIDGGSADGSVEFLNKQTDRIQNKHIISQADAGIYDAMNKGIKAAKGDYLLFLNAGDELATADIFKKIGPCLEKGPDFVYGDSLEGDKRTLKPARRYKDLPWGMFTHHQAMIYRRHTVRDLKLRYSILYEIAGDYDFTARFLKESKAVVYVPLPFCVFEQGGISQKKAALGRKEQFIIREELRLVSQVESVWIYFVQGWAWRLKSISPALYGFIKGMIFGFIDRRRSGRKPLKKS